MESREPSLLLLAEKDRFDPFYARKIRFFTTWSKCDKSPIQPQFNL